MPAQRSVRLIAALAALGTAALLVAGCSEDKKDSGGGDATTILQQASETVAALKSATLKLETTGKVPSLNVKALDAKANTSPAQAQGEATLTVDDKKVPFVYIDGHFYAKLTGDKYDDYGEGESFIAVGTLLDKDKGLPSIIKNLSGAETKGDETVNGVASTKITGTVTAEKLKSVTGAQFGDKNKDQANAPVPVTLWVAKDGNQVVKLEVTAGENATVAVSLSDWNQPVTVTKPTDLAPAPEKPSKPTSGAPRAG